MDLGKTFECLENASSFIEDTIAGGGNILMVGTKRQAQEVMREAAVATEMPFCVSRWLGGTLTNFSTILKSIAKYKKYLSMETDGSLDKLPKKELAVVRREMSRMNRNFEGLLEMPELPDAIFIIDIKREDIAVAEARRLGIPVIALVDTNSDPTLVDYPIPGNDDAVKSIRIIVETIMEALQNGMSKREANKTAQTFVAEPTMESYSEQVAAEAEENMEEITVTIDPELMVDQEGKRESSEESQS